MPQLFPYRKVEISQRYLSDAGVLNVTVPMALTPTEAAAQLRLVLIEHYKAIDHNTKSQRVYELTPGAEVKVSPLRAYLATYDLTPQQASLKATTAQHGHLLVVRHLATTPQLQRTFTRYLLQQHLAQRQHCTLLMRSFYTSQVLANCKPVH
jgi:hypothetical protein